MKTVGASQDAVWSATDESGGALPGITLTISSPALQLPSMTMISDGQGRYRFIALRAGGTFDS
jgi:hypothetical protein